VETGLERDDAPRPRERLGGDERRGGVRDEEVEGRVAGIVGGDARGGGARLGEEVEAEEAARAARRIGGARAAAVEDADDDAGLGEAEPGAAGDAVTAPDGPRRIRPQQRGRPGGTREDLVAVRRHHEGVGGVAADVSGERAHARHPTMHARTTPGSDSV
jgi:hypothetical protein